MSCSHYAQEIVVITLDSEDEDTEPNLRCGQRKRKKMKNNKNNKKIRLNVALSPSLDVETPESCDIASTADGMAAMEVNICDESIQLLEESPSRTENMPDFIPLPDIRKSHYQRNKAMEVNISDESIHLLEKAPSRTGNMPDFIPLHDINRSHIQRNKASKELLKLPLKQNKMNNDDIIVEEPVSTPRLLRPIVIDGCNVAIEHGKVSHCFSSKGIKLAIDYFLNRGHTQVTAFVPKFRRFNNPNRNYPTKDPEILEDLAKKQYVVFTPSRRVNGNCLQSYDDRFIVQLASRNGGVIVSNNNYRDLLDQNDAFKKAIEERLLMFCFVGDDFMVPEDPLGRNGPKLRDFLCLPHAI